MLFRPLKSNEIEVRVGTVGANGVTLLLYKNARVDMAILDETLGPGRWQRDHKEVKGNLFCGIGIRDDDGEWVWKWDCGVESNTEKEKGEASDSFKRAGVNWGIGRELYTGPKVQIKCKTVKDGDRYKLADKWAFWGAYVDDIGYSIEYGYPRIVRLSIKNRKDEIIYEYTEESKDEKLASNWQRKTFADMCGIADKDPEEILKAVGWDGETMTESQYARAIALLTNHNG